MALIPQSQNTLQAFYIVLGPSDFLLVGSPELNLFHEYSELRQGILPVSLWWFLSLAQKLGQAEFRNQEVRLFAESYASSESHLPLLNPSMGDRLWSPFCAYTTAGHTPTGCLHQIHSSCQLDGGAARHRSWTHHSRKKLRAPSSEQIP